MLQITLKKSDGTDLVINMPETLSEVKLKHRLDFDNVVVDIVKWLKESSEKPEEPMNTTYYLYLMARAVSEFTKCDLATILSLDASHLLCDEGLRPSVLQDHITLYKDKTDYDAPDSLEHTLDTLYAMIHNLCNSYTAPDSLHSYVFEWKGQKFTVPGYYKIGNKTHGKIFDKVSVIEAVEAFQVAKWANKAYKIPNVDKTSVALTEIIRTISIFARKEGEQFPLNVTDAQKLIEERSKLFADLDVKTSMDLYFFLSNTPNI